MNRGRRVLLAAGAVSVAAALSVALAPAASAHPLGNFTRNTYVGFTVSADALTVDHVLDLAEVPTFQERHAMDTDGDGHVSATESDAWGQQRCAAAAGQIVVTTDRGPVAWTVGRSVVSFPPGQGGLPITRLECSLSAVLEGARSFDAAVSIEAGRVGWHEITAAGDGVVVTSDVPATTSSARLTAYPVGTSMDVDGAHATWVPGGPGAARAPVPPAAGGDGRGTGSATSSSAVDAVSSIAPRGLDGATRAFTDLVGRHDVTLGFGLLALAIALVLGGLHALAPGHGKTLMAASLVGTGGRRRDAFVLGASVTVAHTAGVVTLALALSVSSAIAPETAYPWLGLASAVLAVGVGLSLLRQTRGGGRLHGHSHGPGQGHAHGHEHGHPHEHPHPHPHPHDDHHRHGTLAVAAPPAVATAEVMVAAPTTPVPAHRPATRRVIALGLAGGLVPSPSAVVVLLAGFALGRSWFALLLVVAYGLGMAMTLCLTGIVLVRAGGLSRRVATGDAVPRSVAAVLTRLPLIAASTVIATGLWLGVRSILAM